MAFKFKTWVVPTPGIVMGLRQLLLSPAECTFGLDELVTDDPVVPENETQVETSYSILQTNPHKPNGGALVTHGPLSNGSHAVVRRYEFYKYTGAYDPLTHEALCLDGTCSAPGDGELGDYIGAQMAAVNLGVPSITIQKSGTGTVNGTAVGANVRLSCGSACSANVPVGTVVTLTANPGNNIFAGWSGACNGNNLTCTVTVNDAITTTATFLTPFTLSVSKGSGTVTSDDLTINCGKTCSAKY